MLSFKKSFLGLLTLVIMLATGCHFNGGATPIGGATLHGTYTATVLGIQQSFTFEGDTVIRYDPLGGKAIFEYYFTDQALGNIAPFEEYQYQPPPKVRVPPDHAKTIWMRDVTTDEWNPAEFKYVVKQDIVVLWDVSYFKQ